LLGVEASIGGNQSRRAPEVALVFCDRGNEQLRVAPPFGEHFVAADDLVLHPHPPVSLYQFILKDFKSNNLATADSKGLAGRFFVSAHSKGVTDMYERQSIAPSIKAHQREFVPFHDISKWR